MSQTYELTGKIKLIQDPQSFASGFTKRLFVVTTTDDKYPQDVALEFVKDACAKLDAYAVGNEVAVTFNIRGNEYNGKYYVQLSAWKIEKLSDGDALREPQGARSPEYSKPAPPNSGRGMPAAPVGNFDDDDDSDSIPF